MKSGATLSTHASTLPTTQTQQAFKRPMLATHPVAPQCTNPHTHMGTVPNVRLLIAKEKFYSKKTSNPRNCQTLSQSPLLNTRHVCPPISSLMLLVCPPKTVSHQSWRPAVRRRSEESLTITGPENDNNDNGDNVPSEDDHRSVRRDEE